MKTIIITLVVLSMQYQLMKVCVITKNKINKNICAILDVKQVRYADYSDDWDCSEESDYTGQDECAKPLGKE